MPADYFISYTSPDKAWAEWIGWVLEDTGATVILQAWDFVPGSNFVLEMQRAAATAPGQFEAQAETAAGLRAGDRGRGSGWYGSGCRCHTVRIATSGAAGKI